MTFVKRSAAPSGHESLRDPILLYSVLIKSSFVGWTFHSNYANVEFWERINTSSVKCGIYDLRLFTICCETRVARTVKVHWLIDLVPLNAIEVLT